MRINFTSNCPTICARRVCASRTYSIHLTHARKMPEIEMNVCTWYLVFYTVWLRARFCFEFLFFHDLPRAAESTDCYLPECRRWKMNFQSEKKNTLTARSRKKSVEQKKAMPRHRHKREKCIFSVCLESVFFFFGCLTSKSLLCTRVCNRRKVNGVYLNLVNILLFHPMRFFSTAGYFWIHLVGIGTAMPLLLFRSSCLHQ